MFNADTHSFGVTRLVLINAGMVDYIDLNLSVPLHLHAANNVGKTSIINTLQFLYIDDMKHMIFPTDTQATVNFYFRDSYSYLIYECVTKTGTYCIVLNRPDGCKQYYKRYVIKKEFDLSLFCNDENKQVYPWDHVASSLALLGDKYWFISNKHLFNIFTGHLDKQDKDLPNLALLPLNQRKAYDRFKIIYRNLLSMSTLKLDSFKDLLLSCVELDGFSRSVDFLEKKYKADFDRYRDEQRQYDYYAEHESNILEVCKSEAELDVFEKQLGAIVQSINVSFKHNRDKLVICASESEESCRNLETKLQTAEQDVNDFNKTIGSGESDLKNITKQLNKLDAFREDENIRHWIENGGGTALEARLDTTRVQYNDLKRELEKVPDVKPDKLEKQIKANDKKIIQLKKTLESSDKTMLDFLRRSGLNDQALSSLYRLFREDVFTATSDQFAVQSEKGLITNLRTIATYITDKGFSDNTVSIELPESSQDDLNQLTDIESINADITLLEQQRITFTKQYELITENSDKISQRDTLLAQIKLLEGIFYKFKQMLEMAESEQEAQKDQLELTKKLKELRATLETTQNYRDQVRAEYDELQTSLTADKTSLQVLTTEYSQFESSLSSNFENIEVGSDPVDIMGLQDLIDEIGRSRMKMDSFGFDKSVVNQRKKKYLDGAGVMYDNNSQWLGYLERHRDLSAASEKVNKNWQIFLSTAKTEFNDLIKCVDAVSTLLGRISRSLNKNQISNLDSIKISVERSERYENALEFVTAADDLFTDEKKRDVDAAQLSRFFSGPHTNMLAEDLFYVNIEMINPSNASENRNVISFENESEGTNFTIKAILLSELLHEQFRHGRNSTSVYFHYYLDEIGQLDASNLRNIVKQNLQRRLVPITAAPRPVIDPLCHPECHLVTLRDCKERGKTVVDYQKTFTAKETTANGTV